MRRSVVAVIGACMLALAPIPAGAATVIHVDQAHPACDDEGPASPTTPLCTINAGTAQAVAGDTVVVASGTYGERVTMANSGTSPAPIVVTVADGASVTVTQCVSSPTCTGTANGFKVNSRSWVTIRGFNVVDTAGHGINVTDSSNIIIEGNDVSGAGAPALLETARGISLSTTTSSVVRGNVTHDNSDAGIFIGVGSTGNLVTENTSSDNAQVVEVAAAGIDVRGANSTVTANVSFDNEDSGINVWNGALGSLVANNVVYRNGDHGIDIKLSDNVKILSNTVYDTDASGIEVFNSAGVVLANNILVDNGLDSPGDSGNLFVDAASVPTMTLDYDLLDLTSPGVMIAFGGVQYTSVAAFSAATGHETHGVEADPLFSGASSGDLRLLAGSPAIDSANSGVASHPATDAEGNQRVDDPATPDTGAGPRLFDDRGAFEFLVSPPGMTVPAAPTIGMATAGPAQASLTWTAPADDGGSPVTGYEVTPYVGGAAQPVRTFNSAATTQTITGLAHGTSYTFKVAAINAIGTGAQSAASNAVTPTPPASFNELFQRFDTVVNGSYTPLMGALSCISGSTLGILFYAPGTARDFLWTDVELTPGHTLAHGSVPLTVNGTYEPFIGDFDGDGCDDVFWYAPGSGSDFVWYGNQGAAFSSWPVSVNGDYTPVVGDFDNTPGDDIFWYADGGGTESIWQGAASRGSFTKSGAPQVSGTAYRPLGIGGNIIFHKPGAGTDYYWTTVVAGQPSPGDSVVLGIDNGSYVPIHQGDDTLLYGPGTSPDKAIYNIFPDGSVTLGPGTINGTYRITSWPDEGLVFFHGPGSTPDFLWAPAP